jgi:hypothetical protein
MSSRLLTRLFYRPDGELSPLKICGSALGAVVAFTAVSVPLLVAGGVSSINGLATWVLILLLGVKLPALAIFWWMLGRHLEPPGQERLSADDVDSLVQKIEAQAVAAATRPDATEEFRRLLDDAWYVADKAPDEKKAVAVACALHIQEQAAVRDRA